MFCTACRLSLILAASLAASGANAQVRYQPYDAPSRLGYPVPFGYLQPDETLGTSPSFEVFPDARGYAPVVRVIQRCQYPDGWNVTDFNRDVNGIPAGVGHTCPAVRSRGLRTRY